MPMCDTFERFGDCFFLVNLTLLCWYYYIGII